MARPATDWPPRARLFVALDLPATTRDALAAWARDLLGADPALRLVPAEALHVTPAFIGFRDPGADHAIAAAVTAAAAGQRTALLAPGELAALPVRRPRVLALDLLDDPDGRAAAVQGAVARRLESAGFYEAEARPFRPHVTVARVRKGARPAPIQPSRPPVEPFTAAEVVLYRSDLRPEGARYSPLARARLAGGDA
jgi:RNA 2',3'-cyclic 3'-phosphodiesterase